LQSANTYTGLLGPCLLVDEMALQGFYLLFVTVPAWIRTGHLKIAGKYQISQSEVHMRYTVRLQICACGECMGEWRYGSSILDICTSWRRVLSFTLRPLYFRVISPRYRLVTRLVDRRGGWTPCRCVSATPLGRQSEHDGTACGAASMWCYCAQLSGTIRAVP
jgi:hypothetical protein